MKIRVLRKYLLWYWRLEGKNGAIYATSETYFSKWNAMRAAKKLSEQIKVKVYE